MDDTRTVAERRADLEAQLAALPLDPEPVTPAPWSGPPAVRPQPVVPPVKVEETGLDTIEDHIEEIPEGVLSATFRGVTLGTWLARLEAIFSTHFAASPVVSTAEHKTDEKEAA